MHMTIYVTSCHLYVTSAFLFGIAVLPPSGAMAWPPFCPDSCICGLQTSSASPEERRTIECSSAGMTSPPANMSADVEMLLLGSNRVRPGSLNALTEFTNLTEINLAQNHIYALGDIKVVLASLLCFVIDGNELDYLANESFGWAPHLRRLSIRKNKIELIHAEAFVGLADLRALDLSGNRLFSVIPEWFRDLVHIEELDLGQNNIHVLRDDVFRMAASLRSLDVGFNQLQHLYDGAFRGLVSLRRLTLQGNNLKAFPRVALQRLPGLQEANLNRNPFQGLYADSVSNLTVTTLLLSHLERLQFIDRRSFTNLSRLVRLELHNNKLLNYIDPEAFYGVPELGELLLQNNNLSVIEEGMLTNLPSLHVLRLAGNSLFCDCNVLWLMEEVQDQARNISVPDSETLVCDAPTALRGLALKDVDTKSVPSTCAPRILPLYSLEYTIDLGDSLRLNCRAVGRPVPQTDWLLPGKHSDDGRGGDPGGILVLKTGKQREGAGVQRIADHISISLAGTLTVRYAAAPDGGEYTCLASNPRGRDERTAHVHVKTDLAEVLILGATEHSVTVTWRSRSFQHAYRILYKRSRTNETYHAVDIEPYMRTFTANDLTPKTSYEFCIAMQEDTRTVRIHCTLVETRRVQSRMSGLFNARNLIIGGSAGCFALLLIVVCTATYFIKRYNRRKRAQEELYSDNLSQLFLASMDSMSDTTPITYENTGAEMFDDDDIDEIRSTASMPGCSSTYTSVIR